MVKTPSADPWPQPLGEIARLLQMAADSLWEAADTAGVDSPLHSLGLGSFLAAAQATRMLPAATAVSEHPVSETADPVRMLEAVEELTQQLDPRQEGVSDLGLSVADLVREARRSDD